MVTTTTDLFARSERKRAFLQLLGCHVWQQIISGISMPRKEVFTIPVWRTDRAALGCKNVRVWVSDLQHEDHGQSLNLKDVHARQWTCRQALRPAGSADEYRHKTTTSGRDVPHAFTGRDRLTMCYFPYFSGPKTQLRDTTTELWDCSHSNLWVWRVCFLRHPKNINVSAFDIYASFFLILLWEIASYLIVSLNSSKYPFKSDIILKPVITILFFLSEEGIDNVCFRKELRRMAPLWWHLSSKCISVESD